MELRDCVGEARALMAKVSLGAQAAFFLALVEQEISRDTAASAAFDARTIIAYGALAPVAGIALGFELAVSWLRRNVSTGDQEFILYRATALSITSLMFLAVSLLTIMLFASGRLTVISGPRALVFLAGLMVWGFIFQSALRRIYWQAYRGPERGVQYAFVLALLGLTPMRLRPQRVFGPPLA